MKNWHFQTLFNSRSIIKMTAVIIIMVGVQAPVLHAEGFDPREEMEHALDIDDVLKISEFGRAEFSPDGRYLAYNIVPPYDELSDYSQALYSYTLSGHQVWIKSLDGSGAPQRQPGLDLKASNYILGFSPDSQFLVTLEMFKENIALVACRVGKNACVRVGVAPDIRDSYVVPARWNERLVWTSANTFVVATRPPNLPGSGLYNRGLIGRRLWTLWNQAWEGKKPTASEVVSTGRDRSQDWAEGALIEVDVVTGATRTVADGRHAEPRLSPDGKTIATARVGERVRPDPDAHLVPAETHPAFDRRYVLELIDRQTGRARTVAEPFNIDPGSVTWSQDGQTLVVFGWGKGESVKQGKLYTIAIDSLMAGPWNTQGLILANNVLVPNFPWPLGPAKPIPVDGGLLVFAQKSADKRYDWQFLTPGGGGCP